ncbi:leukosialin [Polypterus senegalus]
MKLLCYLLLVTRVVFAWNTNDSESTTHNGISDHSTIGNLSESQTTGIFKGEFQTEGKPERKTEAEMALKVSTLNTTPVPITEKHMVETTSKVYTTAEPSTMERATDKVEETNIITKSYSTHSVPSSNLLLGLSATRSTTKSESSTNTPVGTSRPSSVDSTTLTKSTLVLPTTSVPTNSTSSKQVTSKHLQTTPLQLSLSTSTTVSTPLLSSSGASIFEGEGKEERSIPTMISTSSSFMALTTGKNDTEKSSSNWTWIVIFLVIALLISFCIVLTFCISCKKRQRSKTLNSSLTKKKKKGKEEDAWAGPMPLKEDNVTVEDEGGVSDKVPDAVNKRTSLSTFFGKRKSRQASVILESVSIQEMKDLSKKEEDNLSQPLLGPHSNGCPSTVEKPNGTTASSSAPEENGCVTQAKEGPLSNNVQPTPTSDVPPKPEAETDLPPPPPLAEDVILKTSL